VAPNFFFKAQAHNVAPLFIGKALGLHSAALVESQDGRDGEMIATRVSSQIWAMRS
jgi:hypothetical protein